MQKVAPLTKLILTAFVTLWSILLHSLPALGLLSGGQLLLLACSHAGRGIWRGVASLLLFAALLAGLQYVLSGNLFLAAVTAGKMVSMTLVFFLLLATTRMQDLSTALVSQCHVPYEYAFMLTAALRFIPDFLAESKAIQEAQACRGYRCQGNPLKRIVSYMAILKPLVLKAVSRSETMALSLELRGFGSSKTRSFRNSVSLTYRDHLLLLGMTVITGGLIWGG
ncbi:abc/ecf transporter transmembrane component [Lucifera butyrica]|uniref:Abc/ecf transporter transmembrane component n=1 Tax=Lucifera butyrica TaxID=1351585 RepID=A0A498R7A0_9FIRM|nr:energy-coupling factor transporter transmembrane component T [Lucifera butyrica]VBB06777.1 abc/ecf transporter transmembrane component [Lucifera butyrica]